MSHNAQAFYFSIYGVCVPVIARLSDEIFTA